MVEDSNIIPQCIEAYVTNCERFGHRLVPIIDLTKEDADQRIRDAIYLERLDASEEAGQPEIPEPTDAEVAARRKCGMSARTAGLDLCAPISLIRRSAFTLDA
jgi:hypothetical protein